MESVAELAAVRGDLRSAGLRATASRVAVLRLLRRSRTPLSHGEVVQELPAGSWDRATLYRNLIDLERVGLLRRTQLGEPVWRFEDAHSTHGSRSHPHFVCNACGRVVCLPGLTVDCAAAAGCRLALVTGNYEVQLRGTCDRCRPEASR